MKRVYRKLRTTRAEQLRMDRAALVRELMSENGYNQTQVAGVLGISRQAINQLLQRYKLNARQMINYDVAKGHISKPKLCDKCKIETKLEAHHPDHFMPLDVTWLCKSCHVSMHLG